MLVNAKGQADMGSEKQSTYPMGMRKKATSTAGCDLTAKQRAELDRRLEEHRRNPEQGKPIDDVLADIRRRSGS